MKKLLFALALIGMLSASAAEAKLAQVRSDSREGCMTEWTPFALTLVGPVGLPWGDWNVKGLQIGIWNDVYEFSGLQLGVVNIADRAHGVQIGVVNVISGDDIPFLPIFNWSF